MTSLSVTRLTLREAFSRRLVLVAMVLSAVYLALVGLGFWFVRERTPMLEGPEGPLATTVLTVLALYVVSFLSAFLALFLGSGSVSSEVDSGQLHAVLARPLSRGRWLLERWLGLVLLAVPYTVGMGAAVLGVAALSTGYGAVDVAEGLALLGLQTLALLSLGVLVSTRWPTLAAGAVSFFAFGLAWMGGIVEYIGTLIGDATMERIGVGVSLVLPSDALWRAASYQLASPAFHAATAAGPAPLPFLGSSPIAVPFLAWSVLYVLLALALAVRGFAHRDL